jgi:cbb3-type cytochrome oxidase maturation protein
LSVILILVAFSLTVAAVGLVAFFWSVRSGQFDDPYGSSVRILFEDEHPGESKKSSGTTAELKESIKQQ